MSHNFYGAALKSLFFFWFKGPTFAFAIGSETCAKIPSPDTVLNFNDEHFKNQLVGEWCLHELRTVRRNPCEKFMWSDIALNES